MCRAIQTHRSVMLFLNVLIVARAVENAGNEPSQCIGLLHSIANTVAGISNSDNNKYENKGHTTTEMTMATTTTTMTAQKNTSFTVYTHTSSEIILSVLVHIV